MILEYLRTEKVLALHLDKDTDLAEIHDFAHDFRIPIWMVQSAGYLVKSANGHVQWVNAAVFRHEFQPTRKAADEYQSTEVAQAQRSEVRPHSEGAEAHGGEDHHDSQTGEATGHQDGGSILPADDAAVQRERLARDSSRSVMGILKKAIAAVRLFSRATVVGPKDVILLTVNGQLEADQVTGLTDATNLLGLQGRVLILNGTDIRATVVRNTVKITTSVLPA